MKKYILFSLLTIIFDLDGTSQPAPGDIFREYIWITPTYGKSEKFLRVGGSLDYRNEPEKFPPGYISDGYLTLPYKIDLKQSLRAEVQIEKNLCHEGTQGLSIKINDSQWYTFPEADSIPYPPWNYLHHTYPVVRIPLEILNVPSIRFQFRVDSIQEWGWPQNLLYSVIFRIYYEASELPAEPEITFPKEGSEINGKVHISLGKAGREQIISATFIGKYLDVNYEGDGVYNQWHYAYYRGEKKHHLGKAREEPFEIQWNTEWVPDQPSPVEISAIIQCKNGMQYFTDPVKDLLLKRN
jgi:hypothetical protein